MQAVSDLESVNAVSTVLSQPPPLGICTLNPTLDLPPSAPYRLRPADSSSALCICCISQNSFTRSVLPHSLYFVKNKFSKDTSPIQS